MVQIFQRVYNSHDEAPFVAHSELRKYTFRSRRCFDSVTLIDCARSLPVIPGRQLGVFCVFSRSTMNIQITGGYPESLPSRWIRMAKLSTASIFCCGKCSRPIRRRLYLHLVAFTIARAEAHGRKYIYDEKAVDPLSLSRQPFRINHLSLFSRKIAYLWDVAIIGRFKACYTIRENVTLVHSNRKSLTTSSNEVLVINLLRSWLELWKCS